MVPIFFTLFYSVLLNTSLYYSNLLYATLNSIAHYCILAYSILVTTLYYYVLFYSTIFYSILLLNTNKIIVLLHQKGQSESRTCAFHSIVGMWLKLND